MYRIEDNDGIYGFRYIVAVAAAVGVAFIVLKITWKRKEKGVRLPPGPPPLPVIGNLNMKGKPSYRDLEKLAQKYGPIMFMRLGCVPTVVVSSAEMAKEVLKTHDVNFACRPVTSFGKTVMYDCTTMAFSSYGPYWKWLRKVVSAKLLGPRTVESFQAVRSEEMACMVDGLAEHCRLNESSPVNFRKLVAVTVNHTSWSMGVGRKHANQAIDSGGFYELNQEFFNVFGHFNAGDFIPWLKHFDVQGLRRCEKKLHERLDAFLDRVVEEHIQSRAEDQAFRQRDYVDILLNLMVEKNDEERVTQNEIKLIILDMLVAGVRESTATIWWAMSELLINPSIMKKVQEELDDVVGMDCKLVEESNLPRLEYLLAVAKETLRVHPPEPLLTPRISREECTISGYHIPAKSRIIVNEWAIAKDPRSWGDDVGIFKPERFIGSSINMKGHHFEFLPFGAGRRICPGLALGLQVVLLVLANLLHCFDWQLPRGITVGELDMAEGFVQLVPIPRLHKTLLHTKN